MLKKRISLHNINIKSESARADVEAVVTCFHLAKITDDGDHTNQ